MRPSIRTLLELTKSHPRGAASTWGKETPVQIVLEPCKSTRKKTGPKWGVVYAAHFPGTGIFRAARRKCSGRLWINELRGS